MGGLRTGTSADRRTGHARDEESAESESTPHVDFAYQMEQPNREVRPLRKGMGVRLGTAQWEDVAKLGRAKRLMEVVGEIRARSTGQTLHFHTAKAWLGEWLAGKRGDMTDRSFSNDEQVNDNFLAHLGGRADLTLAAIGPRDVRSFRDALAKSGRSPLL
jgi:hypothetical protein